jgi:hypothetical protein
VDLFAGPGARTRLLPTDAILPELRRRFGDELYGIEEIPAGAYPGLNEPVRVVSVANLLVVDAGMGEALAYEITRALFVHRDALVAIHPEARRLRPESAVRGSPVEFHPGAVRFYREAGVWSR